MKRITVSFCIGLLCQSVFSSSKIDKDVLQLIHSPKMLAQKNNQGIQSNKEDIQKIQLLIFVNSAQRINALTKELKSLQEGISVTKLQSLPFLVISIPKTASLVEKIASFPDITQISSYRPGQEELEISKQSMLLKPSSYFPDISNWIDNGYTGASSIVGLIDSGVDFEHPSLQGKSFIIRKETNSGYADYKNGVRSAHGTGVACIYTGMGSTQYPEDTGIAQDVPTIIEGLAGDGNGNPEDLGQTLSTLDWMLNRATLKPDVINYSFGNGPVYCSSCNDWSGLSKVFDYVVNHYHIPFVKSAGNDGYIVQSKQAPFISTMSVPADNYNGITVANMNPTLMQASGELAPSPNRLLHTLRYTSSRGPTIAGRKKPDLAAPGNDTWTCAPDPTKYPLITYSKTMKYANGYRLVGGTSTATPHVGAATLLLHDAGITSPMAQKALLINSADAWTDSGLPSPDDPKSPGVGAHFPIAGSEWNPSYGWGYINLQKAYDERLKVIEGSVTLTESEKTFETDLPVGGKVTLVHERRVGFSDDYNPWDLSPLSLELIDKSTGKIINMDNSKIDNVHQVDNCRIDTSSSQKNNKKVCDTFMKPIKAIIRVRLQGTHIDGETKEPFALAISGSGSVRAVQ